MVMDNQDKTEFKVLIKEAVEPLLVDRPTRKELKSILKAELKNRPTISEVQDMLLNHPTHDDVKTIIRSELKNYATKDDLKQLENKIDDMGQTIVDAIERGMSAKADKSDVEELSGRVNTLELEVLAN